jgi:hypothetical protein
MPWAEAEFEQLDLGDARLNKRARILTERFTAESTASVPKACRGWGEAMAAYRFFDNDSIDWRALMAPHWQQTQQRMALQPVVLCLQDTTELEFNGQSAFGLGPLSYEAQRGMYLHTTYAVTSEREPQGVLAAWTWAREKKDKFGKRGGGLKESLRWIEGYERIAEMATDLSDTRLVYGADREAGLTPPMLRAQELGTPVDWLVRASQNRCLPDGEKLCCGSTWEPVGQISFAMVARHGVKARTVRQQLWVRHVELPAGKGKTVSATCLIAREYDAPASAKPIEWRLLTNRDAVSLETAVELIDWYPARWEIEILFNVLKNACRVEALRLGSMERLERALSLFMVVAWRIPPA